jgi:hypothetical protein
MSKAFPKPGQKATRPLPTTLAGWLVEIALAWMDAEEAKPFGPIAGVKISDDKLFHIAPLVALKFRGWKPTGKKADVIRKAALANYVVKTARDAARNGAEVKPKLAFALCYVAAHFAMDLVEEEMAHEILKVCESELARSTHERM